MHYICDPCFKEAGPIEEKTPGVIPFTGVTCTYCRKPISTTDAHFLAGAGPIPEIISKLAPFEILTRETQPTFLKEREPIVIERQPRNNCKCNCHSCTEGFHVCQYAGCDRT